MNRLTSSPARRSPSSLVRTELLARALEVLEDLEGLAGQLDRGGAHLHAALAQAQARVAERAASVGLAPIASAEELRDLALALDEIAAARGWIARELRLL